MYNVLLAIDIILALFLCGLVMLQRADGSVMGGLGGGTGSSFMTGRSVGNALTKATAITAALFFAVSLALGVIANRGAKQTSILQNLPSQVQTQTSDVLPVENPLTEEKSDTGAEAQEQPAA